jgi:uncharacterized protein YkwD
MPIIPPVRRTPPRLLGLAAVFAAGLLVTLVPTAQRAHADNVCTPDASWGTLNGSYASQVLTLVNQHRASIGVGQLSTDAALTRSAQWKSMNMAGTGYFSHTDPNGRQPGQRLVDCGWPANLGWGENIAGGYPTPDQVVAGWLQSPGHKANIENPSYSTTGVAVASGPQGIFWTQDFGQGSSGGAPPPTTTTPPPTTTTPSTTTTPPPPPTTTTHTTTTTPTTTHATTTTTTTATTTTPAKTTTTTPVATTTVAVSRAEASSPAPAVHTSKKVRKAKKAHKRHVAHKPLAPLGYLNLNVRHHL